MLDVKIGVASILPTTVNRPANGYFFAMAIGTAEVKVVIAIQTNGATAYVGCVRDDNVSWKQITLT